MQNGSLPQVSVVIPAYNARKYIAETLESALNQSFHSFEIIVVDDGSTDGTHIVAEKYRDRGVVLIRQSNAGLGAARNRAISAARGKFVALLDSDDLWEPDYLQTMVGFLDLNPEVSIVFPDTLFFGESKFAGRRFHEVYPPCPPITFAKLAGMISHVSVDTTLRREVFTRVGLFDEHMLGTEDFDLWLRALHAGCRIEPVSKVLVHYRRHAASLSSKSTVMYSSALKALDKWRGHTSLDAEERQAVERTYLQTQFYLDVRHAVDHIHKGEYSLARMALRRACKWRPKWRYRAAQIGLAVAPTITRLALRGRS
jgi:glycosyltransferase involved in cell wall biosynthesis